MMMIKRQICISASAAVACIALCTSALAEVEHRQFNELNGITYVSDDPWQPEGFVNGTPVPATWLPGPDVVIDGAGDDASWSLAREVEVPLTYGKVERAWLKALYTDDEVFIQVRWADSTENRDHHPWVLDREQGRYAEGAQIEDSVLLSFEAGCEWTPSLLGGYIYDFDGWQWLAARSDPIGQAVDLYGNVQNQDSGVSGFGAFPSRVAEEVWQLKFTENHEPDPHADWDQLDRVYMMQPVAKTMWVRAVPDGGAYAPDFAEHVPAPAFDKANSPQLVPQFSPVKLSGDAGEVRAKGQWEDGYWTVEFRRSRFTPAEHISDTIFNRLIQFSVHVFDQVEELDQASESGRLFLRLVPPEERLVRN
jgi:hypothetical protein